MNGVQWRIGLGLAAAVVGAGVVLAWLLSGLAGLLAAGVLLLSAALVLALARNRRLAAVVETAAVTDTLTGLANRDHLQARLQRSRPGTRRVAVLVLDLDDFKSVNDAHGHEFGDRALVAVAIRLRRAVRHEPGRSQDTIARLGGDEFVVLLEGVPGLDDATAVADRALKEVRAPLEVDGRTVFLEASLGLTYADLGDARSAWELLRDADTAMYEAKRAGKHRHEVFDPAMQAHHEARNELLRDLRGAIADDQLRLLFQPQYDIASGALTGVEALVRWDHPEHGRLAPDRFIGLAESSGLIADLDAWVLRTACRQLSAWDAAGLPPLALAVNVSSVTLEVGDLPGRVADELTAADVPAARLEVEITETAAVEEHDAAVAALDALRALGVRVAIDDFGVGHSALSRLQNFPIDRVKIDRAFVAPLTDTSGDGSLVEAMIAMGHGLGLDVVAEGVETEEQLRCLRRLGCNTAQGYLFSKPAEPEVIADLAASPRAAAAARTRRSDRAGFVDRLLAELERTTGLESTYLTEIDTDAGVQRILRSRNTGTLDIPAGLSVPWSDTLCRRALDEETPYTSDVPGLWPDSDAARELGLRTYISVPVVDDDGRVEGTLCGASSAEVRLGPEALELMRHIAKLIGTEDRDLELR